MYTMRRPGMEGHLLFNKAVTKWKKKRNPPHPPNTLMGITGNRNIRQGSCTTLSLAKICSFSDSNQRVCVLRCRLDEVTDCRHFYLKKRSHLAPVWIPPENIRSPLFFLTINLETVCNKTKGIKRHPYSTMLPRA